MRGEAGELLLSGRGVRLIGGGLLLLGLLVPAAGIGVHGAWSARARQAAALRPAMMALPPGHFKMGSPEGEAGRDKDEVQHEVEIATAFAISVTEVTQEQYALVMGENPSRFRGQADLPVENVSFYDALAYCNQLSRLEGLEPCYQIDGTRVEWEKGLACRGYRLPTEAEWEYAARAQTRARYAGGDEPGEVAWFGDNAGGRTHPVGGRAANAWGLHDLSGNVWEWVWDGYAEYPKGPFKDPVVNDTENRRVVRGGSWGDDAWLVRVSARAGLSPSGRVGYQGFRLSRSLP